MAYDIDEIEGIGEGYATRLRGVGITDTDLLLERCGAKKGRVRTAEETGISEKLILSWANMADLMRVSGIGPQNAELLVAAGVDTIKELRNRNAANLAEKMRSINAERQLTKATISEKLTAGWIDTAGAIEPCITH